MTNKFKKFCITLMILVNQMTFSEHTREKTILQDDNNQEFTLFHTTQSPHIPEQNDDPRNIVTDTKRLALLSVAPILSQFKHLENKNDFLAQTVSIGTHNQLTDHSFRAFKSRMYYFIENSNCNTIEAMNAALHEFLIGFGNLDDYLLDESVPITERCPLRGRTIKDFIEEIRIIPSEFSDED